METVAVQPDPISSVVGFLLQLGLPGVIIIVLGYAYYKKDNRVDELYNLILAQSRETTRVISELSGTVQANNVTLSSLKDIIISRLTTKTES
jgi:hypothetical protein